VLSVGRDPQLLQWRNNLLRRHGYIVTDARTVADAMSALGKTYDVVIFGHLVPEEERNQIATAVKAGHPQTKIIMLYLGAIRRAEMADAVLSVGAKPDDLLRSIELLLGGNAAASPA
jgi:DNA-binding response OmpR family regulator